MAPNAQSSSVLSAGSLPHLAIVDKLTEYPIVNSAIGYANDRYAALKSSHHLVNSTLDRAEKSLQLVVNNGVVPVLNKLEQPIHYADNMAVQGLDMAVAKIHVISKQSEELADTGRQLVGQTRQAVEHTAESVKERFASVKTTTVQTVQAKVQSVLAAPSHAVPLLDQILAAGEHVLDYLLPEMKKSAATAANGSVAAAEEAVPANPDTKTVIRLVISRMRRFSEKVQKRIIDYGRDRWFPMFVDKAISLKDGLVLISPLGSKLLSNGHASSATATTSSASPVTSKSSSLSSKTASTSTSSSTPPKTGSAASASSSSSPLATSTPKSGSPAANGDASKSTDEDATVEAK